MRTYRLGLRAPAKAIFLSKYDVLHGTRQLSIGVYLSTQRGPTPISSRAEQLQRQRRDVLQATNVYHLDSTKAVHTWHLQ
jgi:hypothetical protein